MQLEHLRVALPAQLLQQPRRPLHVCEQERHPARRLRQHRPTNYPAPANHRQPPQATLPAFAEPAAVRMARWTKIVSTAVRDIATRARSSRGECAGNDGRRNRCAPRGRPSPSNRGQAPRAVPRPPRGSPGRASAQPRLRAHSSPPPRLPPGAAGAVARADVAPVCLSIYRFSRLLTSTYAGIYRLQGGSRVPRLVPSRCRKYNDVPAQGGFRCTGRSEKNERLVESGRCSRAGARRSYGTPKPRKRTCASAQWEVAP